MMSGACWRHRDCEARQRLTTYWVVIALVIGAAVLVLLAFWHHLAPVDSRRDRRWVALGTSFTPSPGLRSWVAAIDVGSGAEGIDLTAPGATLSGMQAGQLGPALAARPSVAVIWLGASDLLFGTPLMPFLRELTVSVGRLQQEGCQVLLIGLPEMISLPVRSGRSRKDPMAASVAALRSGLRETAELTGSILIDVPVVAPADRAASRLQVEGPVVWLDADLLDAVGRVISPVLADALRGGDASGGPAGDWDEPADPVQRRRLGLPPVR